MFEFNIGEMHNKTNDVLDEQIKEEAKNYFFKLFKDEKEIKSSIDGLNPTLRSFSTLYIYFRGFDKPFELLKTAMKIYRKAIDIDYETTMDVLAKAAFDMDKALNEHWNFYSNLKDWSLTLDKDIPIRDKVYEYFNLIVSLLEGVFKREIWFLISCYQISNNNSKNAIKWRNKSLGSIVNKLKNMPEPVNSLFCNEPIKNIPINQLRNIAAHRDFIVNHDKIEVKIGTSSKRKFVITIEDLLESLFNLFKIRMIGKIFINFVVGLNFEEISNRGYKYRLIPETLINDLSVYLAREDIILEKVSKDGDTINIECKCNTKPDENVFQTISNYKAVFNVMFNDIYNEVENNLEILIRLNNKRFGKL